METPELKRRLILASASPRRRELLERVGLKPLIQEAAVDEVLELEGAAPAEVAAHNARLKARAVASRLTVPALIVAADTIVVLDGRVLGKPSSPDEAFEMLQQLNGQTHQVMTAFVVFDGQSGESREAVVETEVVFRRLESTVLRDYIATGEPFDKAGGYGIQGIGACLVRRIDGSYTNVVGLPLAEVLDAIQSLGGPRALEGLSGANSGEAGA